VTDGTHETTRRHPARETRAVAAALAIGLLLHATIAGAITFGADLSAPTDNPATCASLLTNSCTFLSGSPGPGFYAPATGTVTAVHVKTGNFAQGPMQVLVMRSLYQNHFGDPGHPYFACCFVERYGPVFTPAPNAVTTVPVSLPMVEDPTPPADDFVSNARGDFLAISVLVPNVPVPATFDNASGFSGFAPAPDPQNTPAPSPNPIFATVNGFGYHIAMSADLRPGRVDDVVPVTILTGGQLVGSTAAIPVTCVLTNACRGVLRLTGVPGAAAVRAARAKVKTYGKRRFSIASGQTGSVSVPLNAAGRRTLGNLSSAVLRAVAKVRGHTVTYDVQVFR